MIPARSARRLPAFFLGTLLSASMLAPVPAAAQDDATRIRKLEAEVKALQRKVFPGADGKYFEPEITAAQPAATSPVPPSSGPVTDLLARMDSVESALAQLTAQTEVNQNALRLMNARLEALEMKAKQLEAPMPVEPDGGIGSGAGAPPVAKPAPTPAPAATPPASTAAAAIEKPSTGDAGDDAYVYGFRMWDAGQYAAAQKQLAQMLKDYPTHSRASYAQNLLGRAYLDDGKPRPAAEAFLKNYLDNRGGARAPDSLVYLAIATLQLGNKTKACEALEEFRLVYPNEANGRLASLSGETATRAGCK
ncbi:tetratricopeptide repeat protein [Croceicoccus bisphenolivorans]|uniref:tetratricopeptide repeat protein n=1 Tax=Croceicoccus bisphenolivorans TaxID=1783232 RepID=UPI00082E1D16|nr:tetratricopeptide repeat protein [Croceicoccus bisphenolivorans]